MITKSARLNLSNNESIADVSAISTCGRSDLDTNSSEPSNEEPPVLDSSTVHGAAVLVDSVYIENKIKSLLSQEDRESLSKDATSAQEATELPKPAPIGGILTAEDSCNAVDNKISSEDSVSNELAPEELSFNGKIKGLNMDNNSRGESTTATNSKVNREKLNESFELLTKENSSLMHYNNEKSPDLFADDDDEEEEEDPSKSDTEDVEEDKSFNVSITGNASTMGQVDQMERAILKRLQTSLSGVLPPPSVTYSRIDVDRMITLYKEHEANFCYRETDAVTATIDDSESEMPTCGSMNKPTHTMAELQQMDWPQLLQLRAHGVCYNRSTVTEKIELLGLKYIDRYVGSETASTFNVPRSPSSAKKRNLRFKMLNQSPGSRLSHLARRRAVFSSANLLNTSHGSASAASTSSSQPSAFRLCNRQILIDPKKSNNRRKNKGRTPKRRTPGRRKTPRRKTPGSSAKKRSTLSLPVAKPAASTVSRETSKRALFQSPPNEAKASTSSSTTISSATASRVQKSKRALFSPPKRALRFSSVSGSRPDLSVKESLLSSSSQRYGSTNNIDTLPDYGLRNLATGESIDLGESSVNGKRRREDDCDQRTGKMPRIDSSLAAINEEDLTPRSIKMARSQSFCVGSQNLSTKSASETSFCGRSLFRANSEVAFPDSNPARPVTVLTENHKKKLLWAVSQALQAKQISVKHEQFKTYASNLARVVKRLFLEFNDQTVASTSEKLLRLANKNVFDVIQGRSVDDIYLREKTRILNARNLTKLQGYIAPDEYEQRKQLMRRSTSTSTLLSETSSLADGSQQMLLSQSSVFSQSSEFLNQLSQTQATTAASVLRENIDSELRQKSSAQKQVSFSGKDQKNLSPYADQKGNGSHVKTKLLVGGGTTPSILKAKRQISFE